MKMTLLGTNVVFFTIGLFYSLVATATPKLRNVEFQVLTPVRDFAYNIAQIFDAETVVFDLPREDQGYVGIFSARQVPEPLAKKIVVESFLAAGFDLSEVEGVMTLRRLPKKMRPMLHGCPDQFDKNANVKLRLNGKKGAKGDDRFNLNFPHPTLLEDILRALYLFQGLNVVINSGIEDLYLSIDAPDFLVKSQLPDATTKIAQAVGLKVVTIAPNVIKFVADPGKCRRLSPKALGHAKVITLDRRSIIKMMENEGSSLLNDIGLAGYSKLISLNGVRLDPNSTLPTLILALRQDPYAILNVELSQKYPLMAIYKSILINIEPGSLPPIKVVKPAKGGKASTAAKSTKKQLEENQSELPTLVFERSEIEKLLGPGFYNATMTARTIIKLDDQKKMQGYEIFAIHRDGLLCSIIKIAGNICREIYRT